MSQNVQKPSPAHIRRLALSKHLFEMSVSQINGPEATAALALLSLHDAAELFLQVAAEHHHVTKKKSDFVEYWPTLSDAGITMTHLHAMKRLNTARIGLKHHGIMPAKTEIYDFSILLKDFFYENTPTVFGLEFNEISLIALIQDEEIKDFLHRARGCAEESRYREALELSSFAFSNLLRKQTTKRRGIHPHRPTYSIQDAAQYRIMQPPSLNLRHDANNHAQIDWLVIPTALCFDACDPIEIGQRSDASRLFE